MNEYWFKRKEKNGEALVIRWPTYMEMLTDGGDDCSQWESY